MKNSWEKFPLFLNKKFGIFKKSYRKQKSYFNKKSFDFGLLFLNIQTNTFLKEKSCKPPEMKVYSLFWHPREDSNLRPAA